MSANKQTSKKAGKGRKTDEPRTGQEERTRERIDRPLIPGAYMHMLKKQGVDEHIDHIDVKFYPKGIHDIFIVVKNAAGQLEHLTSGQYQAFRNNLEPNIDLAKEVEAAEAFFKKLESRCWIKCEHHTVHNARRVKALAWPSLIGSAMSLTQSDIKSKKLTPARMFAIWKELDHTSKEMVSAYQREVDPQYDWVTSLATYSVFMERTKREEEEKKKEVTEKILKDNSGAKSWADVDESFKNDIRLPLTGAETRRQTVVKVHDPFRGNPTKAGDDPKEEDDEDDDILGRQLSPKASVKKGSPEPNPGQPSTPQEPEEKKKGPTILERVKALRVEM